MIVTVNVVGGSGGPSGQTYVVVPTAVVGTETAPDLLSDTLETFTVIKTPCPGVEHTNPDDAEIVPPRATLIAGPNERFEAPAVPVNATRQETAGSTILQGAAVTRTVSDPTTASTEETANAAGAGEADAGLGHPANNRIATMGRILRIFILRAVSCHQFL